MRIPEFLKARGPSEVYLSEGTAELVEDFEKAFAYPSYLPDNFSRKPSSKEPHSSIPVSEIKLYSSTGAIYRREDKDFFNVKGSDKKDVVEG
ncbi:MAG: hypothetical protein SVV03_03050 [Candidatus Nanohaloarchaea archaeon]|nr:hypothetical protein [Candidatus Nanohaloarchaea archaeon]